jgi:hypothetical protein
MTHIWGMVQIWTMTRICVIPGLIHHRWLDNNASPTLPADFHQRWELDHASRVQNSFTLP